MASWAEFRQSRWCQFIACFHARLTLTYGLEGSITKTPSTTGRSYSWYAVLFTSSETSTCSGRTFLITSSSGSPGPNGSLICPR